MPTPWVYRDGRKRRDGHRLVAELAELVAGVPEALAAPRRASRAIDALIACGELESALADASVRGEDDVARVTDALARASLGEPFDRASAEAALGNLRPPAELRVSTQEGFAFYSLQPTSYALAAGMIDAPGRVFVVGIRTIGVALSAMVAAALQGRGIRAKRRTVRPVGEPFARSLALDAASAAEIERARVDGALVAIVDEGPGLSGSTFLAVADCLLAARIPRERIILLASHDFDPAKLRAPNAAERFRELRVVVVPTADPSDGVDVSAGLWRAAAFDDEPGWPAVFAQAERKKLLVEGGRRLLKFEGLGPSGSAAAKRARALEDAGIVVRGREHDAGYVSYPWEGRPCRRDAISASMIEHIAEYCALRPVLCPFEEPSEELAPVVARNLAVLGVPADPPSLAVVRAAVVDGRMQPHEWLQLPDASLAKCDAIAHGDDHFFPGPTDIAWDLAGVIVEWDLDGEARARLIERYIDLSGDDVRARIEAWTIAYVTLRAAMMTLAADVATDEAEVGRLARARERYRVLLCRLSRSTRFPSG